MKLIQYIKDKLSSPPENRLKDKSLTMTAIAKASNLNVKNLELPKDGAVPELKKYISKLNINEEIKEFLIDLFIVTAATTKKNKQDNTRFENIFLNGEPDEDRFTINLREDKQEKLKKLKLSKRELTIIGTNFGEILCGIYLLNRFEPIKKISYPTNETNQLIDFLAKTDNGLEYKVSAKYKRGAPAAIRSLLGELKDYVQKHDAKNDWEDDVEQFVYELFKILERESRPIAQILEIKKSLEKLIPETKKYFDDVDVAKLTSIIDEDSKQIINTIVENDLQRDVYNLFKKVVHLLNNHKKIKTVFNKWVSYVNVHQVYLFKFNIRPDFSAIDVTFRIKSFKHEESEFKFATKVSVKEPWKNGINFQLVMGR